MRLVEEDTRAPLSFDQLAVRDSLPVRTHGPYTIEDAVRWAGLQENSQRLHYDRDHVREHNGLRTFIASGAYRQALLLRLLTDVTGPHGQVNSLSVRHTKATFEGDYIRYSAVVIEKSLVDGAGRVTLGVSAANQDDVEVMRGTAVVTLARGTHG